MTLWMPILAVFAYAIPTLVAFAVVAFVWISARHDLHPKRFKISVRPHKPKRAPKREEVVSYGANTNKGSEGIRLTRRRFTFTRPDNPKWSYVFAFVVAVIWFGMFGWPGALYASIALFGGIYLVTKIPSR